MTNVQNTQENFVKCICQGCPTYQKSECVKEKGDKLFCARGRSQCEIESAGCICGGCPVWAANMLKGYYYCKIV